MRISTTLLEIESKYTKANSLLYAIQLQSKLSYIGLTTRKVIFSVAIMMQQRKKQPILTYNKNRKRQIRLQIVLRHCTTIITRSFSCVFCFILRVSSPSQILCNPVVLKLQYSVKQALQIAVMCSRNRPSCWCVSL